MADRALPSWSCEREARGESPCTSWCGNPDACMASEGAEIPSVKAEQIDKSLGLKMISIRLPASMIEDYQIVGKLKGSLYQPLMRMALAEWIEREKTQILKGIEFIERRDRNKA